MLDRLTRNDWTPYLNQAFHCEPVAGQSLSFELIEASSLGNATAGRREPYSLIFRGPATPVLEQGIVELRQDTFGTLALFLVPIGPDARGMCYEAVVN